LKSRIDSLMFRHSPDNREGHGVFVLQNTYDSRKMKRFGFPDATDIAVDDERNLYVASFTGAKVVKIDPNGNGTDIIRPGITGGIYGLDYYNRTLAVTDFRGDRVFIVNEEGKVLKRFGSTGNAEGMFHGPEGICFDRRGSVFVVDSGNYRVQKFDPSGRFLLSFGKMGEYEGEFKKPSDVACINDTVYVTDTVNRKIAVYDTYGNYQKDITMDEMLSPRGLKAGDGKLIISDEKSGVIIFDPVTGEKSIFNTWDKDGSFRKARSAMVDQDGFFYALDAGVNSIYIFSPVEKQYSNLQLEITNADTGSFPVVACYVSVTGRDGRPVYGLKPENFRITEDGSVISNIRIDYLKNRRNAASFVLAVDRSEEMRPR